MRARPGRRRRCCWPLPAAARAQDVDAAASGARERTTSTSIPAPRRRARSTRTRWTARSATADAARVHRRAARRARPRAARPTRRCSALHDEAGITGTYVLVLGREFRAGSDDGVLGASNLGDGGDARPSRRHPGDPDRLRRARGERAHRRRRHPRHVGDPDRRSGHPVPRSPSRRSSSWPSSCWSCASVAAARARAEELADRASATSATTSSRSATTSARSSSTCRCAAPGLRGRSRPTRPRSRPTSARTARYESRATPCATCEPVAEALEEGRYGMTWAREVLAGRTPPERRAPCFFDPRHGPSARDVSWCAGRRDAARRAGLRGRRAARRARRGAAGPLRRARRRPRPVLGGRPGLRAVLLRSFFPGLLIGSMIGRRLG